MRKPHAHVFKAVVHLLKTQEKWLLQIIAVHYNLESELTFTIFY